MSVKEREQKSLLIFEYLSEFPPFKYAKTLAAYSAMDEEVDTTTTIIYASSLGKALYLPVISKAHKHAETMHFCRYIHGKTALRLNGFGIAEPELLPGTLIQSNSLDVILVPLVGFNKRCDRIGMGGGYYDRALSGPGIGNTKFVGLGFACQKAEFDPKPHDVRLHAVITEEGIISY